MDRLLVFTFLVFGFCVPSFHQSFLLHFIELKKTWTEAQSYCREHYSDLATIRDADDFSRFNLQAQAWIGLNDDPASWKGTLGKDKNSWRWSTTGESGKTTYQNWVTGEPDNSNGNELCAAVRADGSWTDTACHNTFDFVCYEAVVPDGIKSYVYITETKMTWEKARDFCRTHYTDLAMIESAQENSRQKSMMLQSLSWIGLYRESWKWSDGSNISFRNWKSGEPNNGMNQYCAAVEPSMLWTDLSCSSTYSFFCEEGTEPKKVMKLKMKIKTTADLSDSATNALLLKQLEDMLLEETGMTNVKLRWMIKPNKEEEDEDGVCPVKG